MGRGIFRGLVLKENQSKYLSSRLSYYSLSPTFLISLLSISQSDSIIVMSIDSVETCYFVSTDIIMVRERMKWKNDE